MHTLERCSDSEEAAHTAPPCQGPWAKESTALATTFCSLPSACSTWAEGEQCLAN